MHCFVCSKQYFRMPFTRWSLNPLLLLPGVLEDLIVPMHYKPGTGRPAVSLVMDHRNLFSSWVFITVHWTMQLYANRLCVCVCIERDSWEENLLELCNKKSNITLMYELAYLLILFFKKGYHFIHLLSLLSSSKLQRCCYSSVPLSLLGFCLFISSDYWGTTVVLSQKELIVVRIFYSGGLDSLELTNVEDFFFACPLSCDNLAAAQWWYYLFAMFILCKIHNHK